VSRPSYTASVRTQRARIAALMSWARTADPSARTQPARTAFTGRFESEVDPDRRLPEEERRRRADAARRAYFAKLALRSAQARRSRAR